MPFNIEPDLNRFKDIIRGKIKSNLGRYVSSEKLLGQQGKKTFSVPVHSLDIPRFTFGSQNGGTGMGDGMEGEGTNAGKAGDQHQDFTYEAEFSAEELADILKEHLELPDIEDKGEGKTNASSDRYNTIRKTGPEGLRSFRRTYKEALKRSITSGIYDPNDPIVIPIKDDKRYRASDPVPNPEVDAIIIYLMDVSGSITDEVRHIAKSIVFWTDLWLQRQYGEIETRFVIHDTEAQEVDREQFFTVSASGGTLISQAYEFVAKMLKDDYPVAEHNIYVCHFTDSDNWSDVDNALCVRILREQMLPNCNTFFYGHIDSPSGSGDFLHHLANKFNAEDNIRIASVLNQEGILPAIKTFFGKVSQ
jgi:uncharacterized protein